jgi:uncharacterized membrane protein YedE/YeeE
MKPLHAASFACGAVFGLGLAVSGMTNPRKVVGFLDITHHWDPTLVVVLLSAVVVATVGFWAIDRSGRRPAFDAAYEPAPRHRIGLRLFGGAALFGVGWGLSGYCPGPGIVSLGRGAPDALVFALFFIAGSALVRVGRMRAARTRDATS